MKQARRESACRATQVLQSNIHRNEAIRTIPNLFRENSREARGVSSRLHLRILRRYHGPCEQLGQFSYNGSKLN